MLPTASCSHRSAGWSAMTQWGEDWPDYCVLRRAALFALLMVALVVLPAASCSHKCTGWSAMIRWGRGWPEHLAPRTTTLPASCVLAWLVLPTAPRSQWNAVWSAAACLGEAGLRRAAQATLSHSKFASGLYGMLDACCSHGDTLTHKQGPIPTSAAAITSQPWQAAMLPPA